jgi:hypothetical protein
MNNGKMFLRRLIREYEAIFLSSFPQKLCENGLQHIVRHPSYGV